MPALGLETRRSSCKVNPNPLPCNINTRHFHHKQPFALQMGTGPTLALWWPLFLAMKFTFLLLNLATIHKGLTLVQALGSRGDRSRLIG